MGAVRLRALIVLGGVLLAVSGCGTAQSTATPTGRASVARTASAARPNPPYTASGARTQPTPDTTGLNCTLPVVLSDQSGGRRGGFLSFPSGRVTDDAAGGFRSAGASSSRINSVAQPTLSGFGYGDLSFDSAARRWLPGPATLALPDGSAYTYAEEPSELGAPAPTRVHVVTVATGADRVIYSGGGIDYPIAFRTEGIYLFTARGEAAPVGLRLLDPQTGAIRVLDTTGSWSVISAGAAWGFNGAYGGLGSGPPRVDRLDLETGAVSTWYQAPSDGFVALIGVDFNGKLIVATLTNSYDAPQVENFYRLQGPSEADHLFMPSSDAELAGFAADSHGLWFGSAYVYGGLWLYRDTGGLRLVAQNQDPAFRIVAAAGPCS